MRKSPVDIQTFAPLAVTLLLTGLVRADHNPIALTPGSFNADVVVENTVPGAFNDYTSATMDGGTNNNAWAWFEQGFQPVLQDLGLPSRASTFSAADGSSRQFQMAADYAANNVLCVYSALPNATFTLTTPVALSSISVLNAGGGGASTINFTIHYQNGGVQSGTLSIADWFNTSNPTIAWYARGRVNLDNGNLGALSAAPNSGSPRLFYNDIALSDNINPVTSIDFSSSSGNRAAIFGLSGSLNGIDFTPVPVTGFNRDMIVESTARRSGFYLNLTTVTMDQGTNNYGNTWYEKGFNRSALTTGVPNANSTFSVGNHTYRMAPTFVTNNVVFLSPQKTSGVLTLGVPATFSALSLVSSAANGPVSISYIVHHADSSSDFGSFNSLDWFNTTPTPVFIANGRYSIESLSFNNVNNQSPTALQPRVFFSDITVSSASPITSIEFSHPGSSARSMIFALGGSVDGVSFNPIAVSGYDADGIVEASAPSRPLTLTTATTVSMDGGTNNNSNTWYEQGFYRLMPNTGLPLAGSTINSANLPDHHYQMPASYAADNAVFVDFAHRNANLTFASPAWYSGLSFLSATVNGRVTNECVIQYSDGTSETNTFQHSGIRSLEFT